MQPDWDAVEAEAAGLLQDMLRCDTTNLPGNELPLARQLAEGLRIDGFEPEVLVSGAERGNLAVRLKGDGSRGALLMLSHLDVVPAEAEKWTYPPFAGQIADGYVWGRGAIDSKLTTAVQLTVLRLCRRLGLPLRRDLVLVAAADEERGGVYGMQWLLRHRPDLFEVEYGINEAGGFALMVDGRPVYTCQVAEKGGAEIDLVAGGRPGHASVPHDDNAIVGLGAALQRLGGRLPYRLTPSVAAFFEGAAGPVQPQTAQLLRAALEAGTWDAARDLLPVDAATRLMFDAMLRDTCAPTMLEAGTKRNVIPSEAVVRLSGRPLPGVGEDEFVAGVEALAGPTVKSRLHSFRPGVSFPHQTPLFAALQEALERVEPGAAMVPYLQTGGTDARFLAGSGAAVYGFIPMRHEPIPGFFELCHGHDERVSLANLRFAVQVLFEAVKILNGIA
jgi:acetylornithine deacetylase/succinyl-diaminopimelate desuccinylase-like protein